MNDMTSPISKKVMSLEKEKVYLRAQADVLIKTILGSKKKTAFDVAFFIRQGFENWKKDGLGSSFRAYLERLVEAGNCKDKLKTFKLAYYVARVFEDLIEEKNRALAFESYRKIANAKLFYKKTLSREENEQRNRQWQNELRREVEGATVVREDFEEKKLDFDAILPQLLKKGYVTERYHVNSEFKGFDDEFKSSLSQYAEDQFSQIQDLLRIQRKKDSRTIPSTQIPRMIKKIQKRNSVYEEEAREPDRAIITYYNMKEFMQKVKEYLNPQVGDRLKIEIE